MTSGLSAHVFSEAGELIASWRRPLLLSHTRPDCDAIGSLLAMRSFMRSWGVEPMAVQFNPTPPRYAALTCYPPMLVWGDDVSENDLAGVDGVVVLDTCTYTQLKPIADWLRSAPVAKVAVDHHVTRDDLADKYVVDESASATCLILCEWARALGWRMDDEACHALFAGVATDTGWFTHANTDARTLAAAGDLISRGVVANDVFRRLSQTDSPARIRLLGVLISGMELHAGDRFAVMSLKSDMLADLKARMSDTEEMINEPMRIASVLVSVLLIEQGDGIVRVSFRSKVASGCGEVDVDVSNVAQSFGGGGHKRAAGARVAGTLEDVKGKVVAHIRNLLGDGG